MMGGAFLYPSRVPRLVEVTPRVRRCWAKECCEKPAPVGFWGLAHERGWDVSRLVYESRWWLECYSCGYICTCEV
jgi:hypothetical protein